MRYPGRPVCCLGSESRRQANLVWLPCNLLFMFDNRKFNPRSLRIKSVINNVSNSNRWWRRTTHSFVLECLNQWCPVIGWTFIYGCDVCNFIVYRYFDGCWKHRCFMVNLLMENPMVYQYGRATTCGRACPWCIICAVYVWQLLNFIFIDDLIFVSLTGTIYILFEFMETEN